MYSYSFFQWLLFFYIYCVVGWLIETTIVSIKKRRFVNRGFLRLPMIPIYGFGAILIILVSLPVKEIPPLVYFFGFFGTSILEYFTGAIMEVTFKVKYWDYSEQPLNIKGRVCLVTSLFWGFLSLILTYLLHKLVESFVLNLSQVALLISLTIISIVFILDVIYSIYTAFDLKKMLSKLTEMKNDIEALVVEKVDSLEIDTAIRDKISAIKLERDKYILRLNYFKRSFINAHPTATSKFFNDALAELKIKFNKKIDKMK